VEDSTPITVDGNKVTLDMGASNPAWRTVEMYMFQDKDDTQLHMFMSTQSCINYLANFAIPALIEEGKLDPTDADAVEKVFADMEARIESINVSFVLKARK
jgi:protein associated with RNAse G/E